MKTLPAMVLAGVAAALAGAAIAASPKTHVMNVPLPDGSIAQIEYVGDVAPRVTLAPAPVPEGLWPTGLVPSFAGFDRMMEQMDRQMRQIEQMARQPGGAPGVNVASYGSLPAGANSVSIVSVSNGGGTCTRTTEVVSEGPGKPPKVTSNVSGSCDAAAQPAPPAVPAPAPARLDRT